MNDSIFSARPKRPSPAITTVRAPLERLVLRTPAPAPETLATAIIDVSIDRQVGAILDDAPALGETIAASFARKEQTLRALFGALEVATAGALHKRLVIGHPDDPIVQQLARLATDRRARLVSYLGEARRRAATVRR